mgnify:CR=1 FL=1
MPLHLFNNYPLALLIFTIGCVVGSFLNVLGLRLLREEEFISKPSYCYQCEAPLKWFDNIPLLSWLLLGGKCRNCKAAVHWQYPVIELLTGGSFFIILGYFGLTLQSILLLLLFCNLIVVLITDFREQLIFDLNSMPLIPLGLIYVCAQAWVPVHSFNDITATLIPALIPGLLSSAAGVGFSFAVFTLLNIISTMLFQAEGFGEGDIRLLMGLGAYFGLQPVIIIFIASIILQSVMTFPLMLIQWISKRRYNVLGCFLVAVILSVSPWVIQHTVSDVTLMMALSLLVAGLATFLLFRGIYLSKQYEDGLTYVPFGPAICLAGAIYPFVHGHVVLGYTL